MKDFEADKKVIRRIMSEYNLNQTQLSQRLGVSKQYVSFLYNGDKPLSPKLKETISREFGLYTGRKVGKISPDLCEIKYTPEVLLPMHNSLPDTFDTFVVDKRLIPQNLDIDITSCYVVTLSTSSLSPIYLNGDRIILDTSKKALKNDCVFAFTYKDVCYVTKVFVMPSRIKCTSADNRDTFYIDDLKEVKVLGMVVPNVRF